MNDEKLETKELDEMRTTNNELADFLGEDKNNLPTVISETEFVKEESGRMEAKIPEKITSDEKHEVEVVITSFMSKLKDNPTDLTLSSDVFKIGEKSSTMAIPHVSLYDELIVSIMDDNQVGEKKEGSKDYNLLKLKRELDLINPVVLAKRPIKQKFLMFFNKSSLPGTDKIMNMIYERKETVKSSIDGIKIALLQNANDLDKQLADLMMVYKGLMRSHRVLKIEIYTAELLYNKIIDFMENITDSISKENINTVLSDLTTQINSLIVEENMNAQFFAGSQMTAKLVREQQNQIRILVRQMEKSVLANLGLRVVAKGLEKSVKQSKALGDAIASTIADTAKANEKTTEYLIKARTEGYINLDKLQEGIDSLERTFKRQAQANELIIKQGLTVSKSIRSTTERLENKIDKSLVENYNNQETEKIKEKTDKKED